MTRFANQVKNRCLVGLVMAATAGASGAAVAGGHPADVKIRIIQYRGYPVTTAVYTGSAAPVQIVTGTAAPVMLNAAPVTLNAAPVTFNAAPTAVGGGVYVLAPTAAAGGSSSGAAAPSAVSGDKVRVKIGSAEGLIDRSALATLLKETSAAATAAQAPANNAQAAPSTNTQQIYFLAAPQTQAASYQQVQVQAAPTQVQWLAAPTQVQTLAAPTQVQVLAAPSQYTQAAPGSTIIFVQGRRSWFGH